MDIYEINFKANSFITVENELDSNNFFIIKSGQIKSTNSVNKISGNQVLSSGDFFGVISAMTNRPRLESTFAISDTKLIVFNKKNFGVLLKKSSPFALKIIKTFSNELRIYDKILAEKTTKQNKNKDQVEEQHLFDIGKFYYSNENYQNATYVFLQFIKHYPDSALNSEVLKCLQKIDNKFIFKNKNRYQSLKVNFKKNEMLFCEDEPGFEAFIIKKGRVKITKIINDKEVLLAVLKPGDIFGEMALLNNTKRAASAVAFEDTECLLLNIENFNKIIQENVTLAVKLITLLSERIWTVYKQIENLSFKKIKTRIFDTLYTQVLNHNIKIAPRQQYLFSIGTRELGEMIGHNDEEFEKSIKEVLNERFLSLYNDKFLCTDTFELKKEAEFVKKADKR